MRYLKILVFTIKVNNIDSMIFQQKGDRRERSGPKQDCHWEISSPSEETFGFVIQALLWIKPIKWFRRTWLRHLMTQ
jgi:hypothetical protein